MLISCGGDDKEEEVQQFLDKAQSAMAGIGVPLSFESVEPLSRVSEFADPLELSQLEDVAAIETAIGALNDALNAGGIPGGGGAVAAAPAKASQSDDKKLETIIHLNLAYLYMLSAVSRCMIDGGDVYTIDAKDNPDTPETELYSLALKPVGQEKLNQVKAKENPTTADFLNIFEARQRQALINAANLMEQVEASVEAIPDAGINKQEATLNRSIYRYSSLYHHHHANQVAPLVGQREVEVANQIGTVASYFSNGLKTKVESWKFKIVDRPSQEGK
jgi:hypothetical protein